MNPVKHSIWSDPGVKAALKDGRPTTDIAVLACPRCGRYGYYNQGSSFWCRRCRKGWYCCSEDEDPPTDGRPYMYVDELVSLDDLGYQESGVIP